MLNTTNSSQNTFDQIPAAAVSAMENGKKLEAIKIVREETGLGLKEAKELVEHYVKQNPAIKSQFEVWQSASLHGLKWLIISIVIIGLTYYYLFAK